jgi:hypothetical protein
MSYVQVEMGGKLRGLKFNKMAQLILESKVQPGNIISGVYALVYAGLKANCYAKDEVADFSFEDACDWADLLSDEDSLKIQLAFQETESYKKGAAYIAEMEAAKKKEKLKPSKSIKQSASK